MYKEEVFALIAFVVMMIVIIWAILIPSVKDSKVKTTELKQKFTEAVKTYNEKNVPLKTNIISKCISGKKAIVVNGTIYYSGDVDSWGDIKGVDCE